MKKIIIIALAGCFIGLSAASIISAKNIKAVSVKATKKLENDVLKSKDGRKAYDGLIKFFNKNISRIASVGFYNSFSITFMNKSLANQIEPLLKPLSRQHQDIIRSIVVKELQKKGYKVTYNKYWDNPEDFNIAVSW